MMKTKQLVVGILAHVDAGKTTLAESILYKTGAIRKLGRVDHQDAFLDMYQLERARGITIFSKQAQLELGEWQVTLLDTPGHVDFSAEMERTLQVLDYAILVISGVDGVQGHVETLWRLLKRYQIPVFLFINKMDQEGTGRQKLLKELSERLDSRCVDFGEDQEQEVWRENLAMCDEEVLETYLETGEVTLEQKKDLIWKRKVFPCFFGSALRLTGVDEFLKGLEIYMKQPEYPETFGAKVYKIARDEQGKRLTYLKVTGGTLKVKMMVQGMKNQEVWEEKADQIRIYSGAKYQNVNEVSAGAVCAVTGLTMTSSGDGLGIEPSSELPFLEPVLTYQILLPEDCDAAGAFLKLRQLEEEEPQLHMVWNEMLKEIHAQVMGEIQMEILKTMILERFGLEVAFGCGSIVYKETIAEPVEGVGHFEPLRHYAEVHLLMEPGEPGSGMQFETACSTDLLDKNWQNLILTHLEERQHCGVLTGAEITDMKITLVAGRAHEKHTEGGDFRQATCRAVRQGLRKAKSILLEPVYEFRLELPASMVGRAMADIQKRCGSFEPPEIQGEMAVMTGTAPVATMQDYPMEVVSYTRGQGRFSCSLKGYEPCHNPDEVIAQKGYDPELDLENPTGSVFCSHGAGFVVSWDQVEQYMHVDSGMSMTENRKEERLGIPSPVSRGSSVRDDFIDEDELEEIFARTYGTKPREKQPFARRISAPVKTESHWKPSKRSVGKEYLLVDGYNIIFAWEDLKELSQTNMEGARNRLMDLLCNYQGFRKCTVILVFDAYKVEGGQGEVMKYHNIHVVYTKEAETADQYIEKTAHEIGKKYEVTVATSDALEQVIVMGQGARRLSAQGLREELEFASAQIRTTVQERKEEGKNYLFHHLPEEMTEMMEDIRLGKRKFEE